MMGTLRIRRQVEAVIDMPPDMTRALTYGDAAESLRFVPEILRCVAHFATATESWSTISVSIRGRAIRSDGQLSVNRHDESYGYNFKPLPRWVFDLFTSDDMPPEVQEAVRRLAVEREEVSP